MNIDWQKINNFGRATPSKGESKSAPKPKKSVNDALKMSWSHKKIKVKEPELAPTAIGPRQRGSMAKLAGPADSKPTPKLGGDEIDDESTDEFLRRAQGPSKQEAITKAAMIGAIVALVCGPLALLLNLGSGSSKATAPPPAAAVTVNSAAEARASDLAKQFIVTWLTAVSGDDQKLRPFIGLDSTGTLPLQPMFTSAADPSLVSISYNKAADDRSQDSYSVTVAVKVKQAGTDAVTRRHWNVPVAVIGDAARALTLPREVAAPTYDFAAKLGYPGTVGDGPLKKSVEDFLAALLCGQGEVGPYLAKVGGQTVNINAIRPAPYKSTTVDQLRSSKEISGTTPPVEEDTVRVLANVNQKVTDSSGIVSQYALTLKWQLNAWRIAALDDAPVVQKVDQQPASDNQPKSASGTASATDTASGTSEGSASTSAPGTSAQAPSSSSAARPQATTTQARPPAQPSQAPQPTMKLPSVPAGPVFN